MLYQNKAVSSSGFNVNKNISGIITIECKGGHNIFGMYITPVDSPYGDETGLTYIVNSFTPINSNSIIIGGGDLNARVGDVTLKFPYTNCHYRKNVDVTVNEYGNILIGLYKSLKNV